MLKYFIKLEKKQSHRILHETYFQNFFKVIKVKKRNKNKLKNFKNMHKK